jgi:hypothetical protein
VTETSLPGPRGLTSLHFNAFLSVSADAGTADGSADNSLWRAFNCEGATGESGPTTVSVAIITPVVMDPFTGPYSHA